MTVTRDVASGNLVAKYQCIGGGFCLCLRSQSFLVRKMGNLTDTDTRMQA
jgi:hypothetical protein